MLKCFLIVGLFLIFIQTSFSQKSNDIFYSGQISPDSLISCIRQLSSDSMQGRKTGTDGQRKAAGYLSAALTRYGIKPLPGKDKLIQRHALSLRFNAGRNIELHQKFYLYLEDYLYIRGYKDTTQVLQNIVFAGYGISDSAYNDYKDIDITGRAVLFYDGEPPALKKKYFSKEQGLKSSWSNDWKKKFSIIYEKKPSIVFIISPNIGALADSLLEEKKAMEFYRLASGPNSIPVIFVSEEMARNFFPEYAEHKFKRNKRRIDNKTSPSSFSISTDAVISISNSPSELVGENIIGMVEGAEEKGQFIVISAHYDHLGIVDSMIYPGADDNASGTSAVLELARIFSKSGKESGKLKRSILFAFFSGEENGLLGSSYFVKNPVVPLQNIVANLNIDMIGRIDSLHESTDTINYVYVIGADKLSDELYSINEKNNDKGPRLLLDYHFDEPGEPNRFYERSDHYHFAEKNIPVIFYFSGVHSDYHKPTDTLDKIIPGLLRKRAELVFLTSWQLADMEKRIKLNRKQFEPIEH